MAAENRLVELQGRARVAAEVEVGGRLDGYLCSYSQGSGLIGPMGEHSHPSRSESVLDLA